MFSMTTLSTVRGSSVELSSSDPVWSTPPDDRSLSYIYSIHKPTTSS